MNKWKGIVGKERVQWALRTSYYLFILLALFWLYVCNEASVAPFIYNDF